MPKFDQHFLRDCSYARRIAEAVQPIDGETILEVGPGHGALTQYLLTKPFSYVGIEIDRSCIERLQSLYPTSKAVWVNGDFLRVPMPAAEAFFFVSNLPYSISGPALFRILEYRSRIRGGVLMLQAEVAQRLYAKPGARPYGRISLLFQSVYRVHRLLRVPPGAFSPPPKVWSEVVVFERQPHISLEEWDNFADFVRKAFRQPRRTLKKNLDLPDNGVFQAWALRRPHELSIETFIQLWRSQ
ncbi:MAG: 16S rRNA (adenine(1518)-N(6)/adenine(1519)-N(6))-dimethyltransferase RsmA [Bacteroidia bacterium]|nr:16S rRNA (adenine(1518)-N(6)/adenine(1519)-N(6))-dimethyltransferase RsmA [Bacteroidia bacterium]